MNIVPQSNPFNLALGIIFLTILGCGGGLEPVDQGSVNPVDPFASNAILELKILASTTNAVTPLRNETNAVNSCNPLAAPSTALASISDCIDIGGVCSTGQYNAHLIFWELKDPDNSDTVVIGSRDWEAGEPSVSANAQCIDGYFKLRVFLPATAEKKRYLLEASIFGVDDDSRLQGPTSNPSNLDTKMLDFSID